MLLTLVALPVLAGVAAWWAGDGRRAVVAGTALGALAATLAVSVVVAADQPARTIRWGSGLSLRLAVDGISRLPVVLVAVVGLAVVTYALGYGEVRGRARLVGLLVAFIGTMELLLVAADLLTLVVAWELVGVVSWGLIAHDWRGGAPAQADQAFLTTRAGDLGLLLAAGAAFAATGGLAFADLPRAEGGLAAVVAGGVLVAAAAKSAQVPFSPWLFAAMAGPTPASALLHSATMVAAGAYLVARLHPFLDTVTWFAPAAVAVGLATALAGGIVAVLQPEAKHLLAASTSAHYGLAFVAVGAGFPVVAVAHLVTHALFKALLFVAAGVAIDTAGTHDLAGMRLGRRLPAVAGLTLVGTLALAGVPPLGGAWTKDEVVAAGAHTATGVAVLAIAAGGLSALYAARFQLLAYGPAGAARADPVGAAAAPAAGRRGDRGAPGRGHALAALALLAASTLVTCLLWTPWAQDRLRALTGGATPRGAPWELAASLAAIGAAIAAALALDRRRRLAAPEPGPAGRWAAGWLGLPALARVAVVAPTLAFAQAAARFDDRVVDRGVTAVAALARWASGWAAAGDDRVVDAGTRAVARLATWTAGLLDRVGEVRIDGAVRGLARLAGAAGRAGRRLQSGQTHRYYTGIAVGAAVLATVTVLWS